MTKIYEYVCDRGGGTLQVASHKTLAATQRDLAKSWRKDEDLENVIVLEVNDDVVTAAWEHDYDLDAWFATKNYSWLVGEKLVDID